MSNVFLCGPAGGRNCIEIWTRQSTESHSARWAATCWNWPI